VPCVSLRGALFSELKRNSTTFPIKRIYHDRHHPSAWGHSLMAQMVLRQLEGAVANVVRETRESGRDSSKACALASREMHAGIDGHGPVLWAPLFSDHEEAPIGACYKDRALQARISRAKGFQYTLEGQTDAKMKPGIVGRAPGDYAQFCIDISGLARGDSFVFIVGHLISYEHMGVARIACLGECECPSVEVDAHVEGGRFSVFKAKTFHAKRTASLTSIQQQALSVNTTDRRCGCKVEVTILPRTGSGEHKFKVLSLMTATREGSLRYGHQAGFNNRPTEARFA
jgi:hypothetical protein